MANKELITSRLNSNLSFDEIILGKTYFSELINLRNLARSLVNDLLTSWAINPTNPAVASSVTGYLHGMQSSLTLLEKIGSGSLLSKLEDQESWLFTGDQLSSWWIGDEQKPSQFARLESGIKQDEANRVKRMMSCVLAYVVSGYYITDFTILRNAGTQWEEEQTKHGPMVLPNGFAIQYPQLTDVGVVGDEAYPSTLYVAPDAFRIINVLLPSMMAISQLDDNSHYSITPAYPGFRFSDAEGNIINTQFMGGEVIDFNGSMPGSGKAVPYSTAFPRLLNITYNTTNIKYVQIGNLIPTVFAWQFAMSVYKNVDRELFKMNATFDILNDLIQTFGRISDDVSDSAIKESVKDYIYKSPKLSGCVLLNKSMVNRILNFNALD